jgi:histone H3/H4
VGLVFCSMPCFDAHLPMMRHRDAWAELNDAPTREQALREEAEAEAEAAPKTVVSVPRAATPQLARPQVAAPQVAAAGAGDDRPTRRVATLAGEAQDSSEDEDEVLVVISKLKKFIRTRSGMNTSDGVAAVLSAHLRDLSVQALRHAAADGRKTVLERDFTAVLHPERR